MAVLPLRPRLLLPLASALAYLALSPALATDSLPAGPERLAGVWRLDPDRSQDLRHAIREAPEARRDGGFSRTPGGGPGGGGPGTGVPPGSFESPREAPDREKLSGGLDAPLEIRITWDAPQLTIEVPEVRTRRFAIDGKKARDKRPDGTEVKLRA